MSKDKIEQKSYLTKEDVRVWELITQTTSPIAKNAKNRMFPEQKFRQNNILTKVSSKQNVFSAKKQQPIAAFIPQPSYQATINRPNVESTHLDKQTRKKISKGKIAIHGKLDLHGLSMNQAHGRLFDYLEYAYFANKRIILVITGKGIGGRGVLREYVPLWLCEAEFRNIVSSYGPSNPSHGGEGALYVRLKRR